MARICTIRFRRVLPCFMVVAAVLAGCGQESEPAGVADSTTPENASVASAIQLVSPTVIVEVESSIMHELQVTLRNTGQTDLKGVTPRLPCSCHVASPLPAVFSAGATNIIAFRVLTPFAGSQLNEIEFYDQEHRLVGTTKIAFHALGEIPRLVQSIRAQLRSRP